MVYLGLVNTYCNISTIMLILHITYIACKGVV